MGDETAGRYDIVDPPDSGEVREYLFEAVREHLGKASVVLVHQGSRDEQSQEVRLSVQYVQYSETGPGMTFDGWSEGEKAVAIETYDDPHMPASFLIKGDNKAQESKQ